MLHPHLVLSAEDRRALSPESDGAVDINTILRNISGEDSKDGSSSSGNINFAETVLANLGGDDDVSECPICLDVMDSPMIVPGCMHRWLVPLI